MSANQGAQRRDPVVVEDRDELEDRVVASLGGPRRAGAVAARAGVTLEVLGLPVRVEVDELAASRVAELLADHARTNQPPQRVLRLSTERTGLWALHDGIKVVRDGMSATDGVAMLLWSLNQVAITTPHHVAVHAGCVARNGAGVVLSGPMEAGKSTLVAALVCDGWDYLSDEVAGLSLADGRLHPYPCPIALDPGSFSLFPTLEPETSPLPGHMASWHLSSEAIRPGSLSAPVVAAALVFPRFQRGEPCTLRAVGATEALHLLVGQAFNLRVLGGRGFAVLADLVRRVPRYQLTLDDLEAACQAMSQLSLRWQA